MSSHPRQGRSSSNKPVMSSFLVLSNNLPGRTGQSSRISGTVQHTHVLQSTIHATKRYHGTKTASRTNDTNGRNLKQGDNKTIQGLLDLTTHCMWRKMKLLKPQCKCKCKVFMKISFHSYAIKGATPNSQPKTAEHSSFEAKGETATTCKNKTNFQMKNFALSLAFIMRLTATRKEDAY